MKGERVSTMEPRPARGWNDIKDGDPGQNYRKTQKEQETKSAQGKESHPGRCVRRAETFMRQLLGGALGSAYVPM